MKRVYERGCIEAKYAIGAITRKYELLYEEVTCVRHRWPG